jgi:hypothetical protein
MAQSGSIIQDNLLFSVDPKPKTYFVLYRLIRGEG